MTLYGTAGQLTSSLLNQSYSITAFAQSRVSVVDSYVANMQNAVLSLVAPVITPDFPTGGVAPAISNPGLPTIEIPVWSSPGFPSEFTAVLETGDLEIEPFDDNPPTIVYGTAPAAFTGTVPDAPGINLQFDDPTLVVNLPAVPDLLQLTIANFAGMTMPTFSAADPVLTAVEPSIREYVPGDVYTSDLLVALQEKLQANIAGGTGLDQDTENAIWDRGREREARSKANAIEDLEKMEALGYSLPPGGYLDARIKIITETDYVDRGHSREVMIKSAELALDSVKHAITTATSLEGQLLNYTNSVEQRMFEASRYATEAGVAIYNAKVQAFAAMTDVYRAKVQVYEALVRAEVAKVDAYRAQIAAEEAKASINRSLVEQYKAQVEAALSGVEIYKAQIAGIQAKAEIERTKVMVFGEQVKGFTAQINAYTAGVEGYRATLAAEQTKQQVYASQVDAFRARVEAGTAQINSRIAAFKGQIDAKSIEYDGYKAQIAGETARVDGIVKSGGVIADAYKALVTGTGVYNEVLTKQWQAVLDQNQRTAEIGVSAAKANAELYITTRSLALDAAKTGATVASQIGAAAINAFNFSASVSSSEGYSESLSDNTSRSTSQSTSNSDSTNYNYNSSI